MSIASKVSGHWTDEQLVEHIYGVGPHDGHLESCLECRGRLASLGQHRQAIERSAAGDGVTFDFLAAQRRRIYARLSKRTPGWSRLGIHRWATAAVAAVALTSGVMIYENTQLHARSNVSDAQLAQEVSQIASDSEPQPIAPLQALFEE
jgi:anti-sigma factor RsiW